jgi:hypothetical protein
MTPAFTVLLPHLRNPGNNAALRICVEMLMENTINEFKLFIDTSTDGTLYRLVNEMVEASQTEAVIYWSSDMFPAYGWDVYMMNLHDPDTFVTNVLVEPGVIGVYPENVTRDFGKRPDTFDRVAFEAWCAGEAKELNLTGEGWFAPVLYPRTGFLDMGGFVERGLSADHHGFTAADMDLFERWKAAGNRVVRARNSYTYHLQRWSQEDEQVAEKRG